MIILKDKECCGCGACFNICPKQAITMANDEYGFYKPVIEKTKCIECHLCEKTCPIDNYKAENITIPKAYAIVNNCLEDRMKSSSGGIFPILAKYCINNGGCVYGVIYNEDFKVMHAKCEIIKDIEKMQNSKYVQSDTQKTYSEAKNDLMNGKLVFYTGTPCQISGLKSYLKQDYENLITVELICHGVPSPMVFEQYKKEILDQFKDNDEKLLNINFRSKVNGWSPCYFTTTTTTTTTVWHTSAREDTYISLFLDNLSINEACFNCHFNKIPRVADLTIGDFWGVDKFDKTINDEKGTSLILINSQKGNEIFEQIKNECNIKEVPLDIAIKGNPNLVRSTKPHPKRAEFLKDFKSKTKTLKELSKKYIRKYPNILRLLYKAMPLFLQNFIWKYVLRR